jgi:predicted nucleotidyltransferase
VASELTPEALARYRATAQRRWEQEQRANARRLEWAWELAQQAAVLLKGQFGATRVVVFGSLAQGHWFSQTSDIDLAAWGLKGEDFFAAVARLQDLSPEFSVDLVAMEHCRPELRQVILAEGIPV